jgi:excisionase family DNA binding protein
MDDTWITIGQAAALLHVHPDTLRKRMKNEAVPVLRVQTTPGGHRRIRRDDVERVAQIGWNEAAALGSKSLDSTPSCWVCHKPGHHIKRRMQRSPATKLVLGEPVQASKLPYYTGAANFAGILLVILGKAMLQSDILDYWGPGVILMALVVLGFNGYVSYVMMFGPRQDNTHELLVHDDGIRETILDTRQPRYADEAYSRTLALWRELESPISMN